MSIHQAKNREFDRVVVLWPYEVSGSDERKRRLAYNAITRARHEAHVIVQSEGRVKQPPFVPNPCNGSDSN
jgi:superfamily I DNA/RNA helicase